MTSDAAFSFEGEEVTDFSAQLPSAKLEAPEAYPRGTLLTLQVQVRVKSVRIDSDKHDNLVRNHILALEECNITEVLTPAVRAELIAKAEAAAEAQAAAHFTVREEYTTTDALVEPIPGQTTIEDVIAEQATEQSDHAEFGEDASWATGALAGEPKRTVVDLDDDDPEHAWMDEDDEFSVHAVIDETIDF